MERVRKKTEFFDATVSTDTVKKKVLVVPEGEGVKLMRNKQFSSTLNQLEGDNPVLKALHVLLYGMPSKKADTKKYLMLFKGFAPGTSKEEKIAKIKDKKQLWTVQLLKTALACLGLPKQGDRDGLINTLVTYLMCPTLNKAPTPAKKLKSVGKGKKSSGDKKDRTISGFQLYANTYRPKTVKENPDVNFGGITRLVAAAWHALGDAGKEEWNNKAKNLNIDKALENGAADDFAESSDEDNVDLENGAADDFADSDVDESNGENKDDKEMVVDDSKDKLEEVLDSGAAAADDFADSDDE